MFYLLLSPARVFVALFVGLPRRHVETGPLTGVPSRAGVHRASDQRRVAGTRLTVAQLEVDEFSQVNHERGHRFGDALLVGCLPGMTQASTWWRWTWLRDRHPAGRRWPEVGS